MSPGAAPEDDPPPVTAGSGFSEIIERERPHATSGLEQVGSMLSYDERLLLHWATRAGNPSPDAVVDAGCFLGGSTISLGHGINARPAGAPRSPLHVYDRFVFGAEGERGWVAEGFDFAVGASTTPVFEHQVRPVRDLLTVHRGDIRRAHWTGDPIGVLFVDIAKTWEVGDAVWRTFLPSLVANESLVVQQDLVHWGHPWYAIAMELLADHFEYLGWVWFSSAVYRCVRPVAAGDLPASLLRDVALHEALELIDRAAERLGEPIGGSLRLSGAVVLLSHGRFAAARARVDEIRGSYSDETIPYISEGFAYVDDAIDKVRAGTIEIS